MLRVLFNRFHRNPSDPFYKHLPQEDVREVLAQEVNSDDPSLLFSLPETIIHKLHYSWFIPFFEKQPKNSYAYFLSVLPKNTASQLRKTLNIPPSSLKLAPPFKKVFMNTLYKNISNQEILPLEFLPETPVTFLARLTKSELVEIIDFLGIYDLAQEVRHVVDKNKLKKLYLCLTPIKQKFLRLCLHQKDKLVSAKLELENWKGDVPTFENILHRRGLLRLGKTLSGQNPQLIWYITRILDTGRSTILNKYITEKESSGVTTALMQQVNNVINFLKKKSES